MTDTDKNEQARPAQSYSTPNHGKFGSTPTGARGGGSAAGIQKLAWTLLLPLPATILVASGETALGALITCGLSLIPAAMNARLAVTNQSTRRFGSGIDALLFFLVSIISGVVAGTIASPGDSKLFRLNYSGFAGETDIAPSYVILLWCFSLASLQVPNIAQDAEPTHSPRLNPRTAVVLAGLGTVGLGLSLTVSRYEVFSSRGETGGNGINSLLYWSAAVFVSYVVVLYSRNSSKAYLLTSIAMTLGLLATGNRSPVALIGLALVVRVVQDRRARTMRLLGLLLPAGLIVFSYQSIWRSLVSKGLPSGPIEVFGMMLANPLQEFLRLGLDTVDGHSLVVGLIHRGFGERWLDPVLAVANFIPRQLWVDKPTLLGSTIGHDYLGMTAGGIFLSGPGYFSLVSGSILVGSILFVLLVLAAKAISAGMKTHPIVTCAMYYLVVRVSIAGDAFDIFLSVQIIVICGLAALIGELLPNRAVPRGLDFRRPYASRPAPDSLPRRAQEHLKGSIK